MADIKNDQRTFSCPNVSKVGFASCMLRDRARDWWVEVTIQVGSAEVAEMTWDEFVRRFDLEFSPPIEVQRLVREFHDLHQSTETMAEMTAKFRERPLLIPQYSSDEEMTRTPYHSMLKDHIQEFVSFTGCKTLKEMVDKAREQEIKGRGRCRTG